VSTEFAQADRRKSGRQNARMIEGPARTCAVCRAADKQSALVRFAVSRDGEDREVILDACGESPGRGAYCHLLPECLKHPKLSRMLIAALQKKARAKAESSARPETLRCRELKDLLIAARERSIAGAPRKRMKAAQVLDRIELLFESAKKDRDAVRGSAVTPDGKQHGTKKRIRL